MIRQIVVTFLFFVLAGNISAQIKIDSLNAVSPAQYAVAYGRLIELGQNKSAVIFALDYGQENFEVLKNFLFAAPRNKDSSLLVYNPGNYSNLFHSSMSFLNYMATMQWELIPPHSLPRFTPDQTYYTVFWLRRRQ